MPVSASLTDLDGKSAWELLRNGRGELDLPGREDNACYPAEALERVLVARETVVPRVILAALSGLSVNAEALPSRPPLARWLGHTLGYAGDVAEAAAMLLSRAVPLLRNDSVSAEAVSAARRDVEPRELATLARLLGRSESVRQLKPDAGMTQHAQDTDAEEMGESHWLLMTAGIPGSGKTTWLASSLPSLPVVSMDRMRQVLLGDAQDQTRNDEIFRRSMAALGSMLRAGKSVAFDATSASRRKREFPCRVARSSGAGVAMVLFDVSLDEARERNRRRMRSVPFDVILQMYRDLEAPAAGEADRALLVSPRLDSPLRWNPGREYLHEAGPYDASRFL